MIAECLAVLDAFGTGRRRYSLEELRETIHKSAGQAPVVVVALELVDVPDEQVPGIVATLVERGLVTEAPKGYYLLR